MIPHHPRPELLQSPSELGWGSDLPLHTQNHPCPDTSGIMNPEPRPHPHLRPATHRQHFFWLIVLEGVGFLGFLLVCFCFTLVCYWDSVYFWLFFHISSYFSNTPVSFQIYFIFFIFVIVLLFSCSLFFFVPFCVACGISVQGPGTGAEPLWWGYLVWNTRLTSDPREY